MQIPFAGPDLEHLFHRLFTAFKVFTEFFKGYSVLLLEELTQFEEDQGCVSGWGTMTVIRVQET